MAHFKIKKLISAVMIFVMIFSSIPAGNPVSVVTADELSDAQDKKSEAESKRHEAERKLERLKYAKEDALEMIEELDSEIADYESKIKKLGDEANVLRAAAAVVENNLDEAYVLETKQYEGMKERIRFAYENGDAEYIEALLSVKDYSSVTNQAEYVEKVSLYDQKQLKELLVIEESISEYKDVIANNMTEIEKLRSEAMEEQQALEVMQDGKRAAIKEYNLAISDTEYDIAELEKIEAEQDAQIAAIEAAAAAARAAAEAAAEAARKQQQEQASSTDASSTNTNMNSYTGGAFTWPCPSSYTITSGYGARNAPTEGASTFHKGIDIGCASGASIVAAADGVVSFTGYFGGGGNTVIIDHGNGLSTLYMHLSVFAVGQGANVKAGNVIGYAGSTGISTGPHLHFAVRVNGSYVDPAGYL